MKTNCVVHWKDIYSVDSAIYLLNNYGGDTLTMPFELYFQLHIITLPSNSPIC